MPTWMWEKTQSWEAQQAHIAATDAPDPRSDEAIAAAINACNFATQHVWNYKDEYILFSDLDESGEPTKKLEKVEDVYLNTDTFTHFQETGRGNRDDDATLNDQGLKTRSDVVSAICEMFFSGDPATQGVFKGTKDFKISDGPGYAEHYIYEYEGGAAAPIEPSKIKEFAKRNALPLDLMMFFGDPKFRATITHPGYLRRGVRTLGSLQEDWPEYPSIGPNCEGVDRLVIAWNLAYTNGGMDSSGELFLEDLQDANRGLDYLVSGMIKADRYDNIDDYVAQNPKIIERYAERLNKQKAQEGQQARKDKPLKIEMQEQCLLLNNLKTLSALNSPETYRKRNTTKPINGSALKKYKKYKKVNFVLGQTSSMLNKLRYKAGSAKFNELDNATASSMLPYVKFYKVLEEDGGTFKQIPILFPTTNSLDGNLSISTRRILEQSGSGTKTRYSSPTGRAEYGIEKVSWSYIGNQPETIKNDIEVEVVLFFQNLDELIVRREYSDGDKTFRYRILDLVMRNDIDDLQKALDLAAQDKSVNKPDDTCSTSSIASPLSVFKKMEIKMECGWSPPSVGLVKDRKLSRTLQSQFVSLFLTLTTHEFNFNEDGTFSLTINYKAREEGLLTNIVSDVILSHRDKRKLKFYNWCTKKINSSCGATNKSEDDKATDKVKERLKEEIDDFKVEVRQRSMTHIVEELIKNRKMFYCNISAEQLKIAAYRNKEIKLTPKDIIKPWAVDFDDSGQMVKNTKNALKTAQEQQAAQKDSDSAEAAWVGKNKEEKRLDRLTADNKKKKALSSEFGFFFLSDLFEIVAIRALSSDGDRKTDPSIVKGWISDVFKQSLKSGFLDKVGLSEKAAAKSFVEEMKNHDTSVSQLDNVKLMLGGVKLKHDDQNSDTGLVNIGDLPVSINMYQTWFNENVVNRDSDYYPFLDFMKDCISKLVVDVFNQECNQDPDKVYRQRLRTALVQYPITSDDTNRRSDSLEAKTAELLKPELSKTDLKNTYWANKLDVDQITIAQEKNALTQISRNSSQHNIRSYLAIYSEDPTSDQLHGDVIEDKNNGIYHLNYGADKGLLKKISFKRSDVKGLKELRYSTDTFNPLTELAAVYNADVELIGNTLFYPSQYIFINPLGFGTSIGLPNDRLSISNMIGLGGYHQVNKVTSTITSDNEFTTSFEALWQTSGDGRATLTTGQQSTPTTPDPATTPPVTGTTSSVK